MRPNTIERYRAVVTIPQYDDTILYAPSDLGLSGKLRGYSITAPTLTAANYTFSLLGAQGETLHSKSSLSAATNTVVLKDSDTQYLAIPFTCEINANLFKIHATSDAAATGVLTSNQTNALNNETVTIGSHVYTFVTSLSGAADEVLIAPNTAATGVITDGNTSNVSNADTVVINGRTYTFKTNLTEAKATGTLTSDTTEVSDGDTITIGSTTYRYKNTIAQVGDIHITGTADTTLGNLVSAINGTGTPGTDYFTGTPIDPNVTAAAVTSHHTVVTDKSIGTAGNAVATTSTAAHQTWGNTTLTGGVNAVVNEIHIGGSADASLTNLVSAIIGAGTAGTDYSTGTTVNTDVTASAVASNATTLAAISLVPATGNAITLTKSAATLTLSGLSGGKLSGGAYTGDTTLENLEAALNGEAGAGSLFGTGTVANTDITSSEVASHALTVTADVIPDTGVATTSTSAAFTWGAIHLVGGGEASARQFTVDLYIER